MHSSPISLDAKEIRDRSAHKFKKAYHRGVTSDSCPSTISLVCIRKLVQPDMSKESSRYNVILLVILCSSVITHELALTSALYIAIDLVPC